MNYFEDPNLCDLCLGRRNLKLWYWAILGSVALHCTLFVVLVYAFNHPGKTPKKHRIIDLGDAIVIEPLRYIPFSITGPSIKRKEANK